MSADTRSTRTATGGAALRSLRRSLGRTQLWVEAEADLGTGYLQRLESGRVVQPERVTLERILIALDARYSERREVLEHFGYAVSTPVPDERDHGWARDEGRRELDETPFPAYTLDCAHRLIAWNRHVPRLFGVFPDDPTLGRLTDRSFLGAWFDPTSPLPSRVADPDAFLPALVRAFLYEMQRFGREPWYVAVLDELMAIPGFRDVWALVERDHSLAGSGRSLVPVRLMVHGAGTLQFRLASEPFVRDARFRMIHYFPADQPTMQWCAGMNDG